MDNPKAAEKVVDEVYDKVQRLQQFPRMGYLHDLHSIDEIRILLYGHYRIAYLIRSDQDIDILGVFHGAFDIERYL